MGGEEGGGRRKVGRGCGCGCGCGCECECEWGVGFLEAHVGGGLRRGRLVGGAGLKSISSSEGEGEERLCAGFSMEWSTLWLLSWSWSWSEVVGGLECASSMLSMRSSFRRGFGRGVAFCWAFWELGVDAVTKRFAGVGVLDCRLDVGVWRDEGVWCVDGGCTRRRLDGCLSFAFWVEGGAGARKRCGEGVCVGILRATFEFVVRWDGHGEWEGWRLRVVVWGGGNGASRCRGVTRS